MKDIFSKLVFNVTGERKITQAPYLKHHLGDAYFNDFFS